MNLYYNKSVQSSFMRDKKCRGPVVFQSWIVHTTCDDGTTIYGDSAPYTMAVT